jgi:hypothetical protein
VLSGASGETAGIIAVRPRAISLSHLYRSLPAPLDFLCLRDHPSVVSMEGNVMGRRARDNCGSGAPVSFASNSTEEQSGNREDARRVDGAQERAPKKVPENR